MPTPEEQLIVLAHRIPAAVTPVGDWLAEVADRVVLITSEEAAPGYAGMFRDVVPVSDYSGSDEVVDHLDRLCADHSVARIIHGTEDDILRIARVRDRHGIPGLSEADALVFRDKYAMKAAAQAGVATPAFLAPADGAQAAEFARLAGWPLVAKPRLGYGSRGVAVVEDTAGLTSQLRDRDPADVLLEAFVPGTVHHVDGFMRDGEVLLAVASRYINSCLSFADGESLGSVQLDEHDLLTKRLVAFAEQVVAVLPSTAFSPFHLEVFVQDDTDALVFCEIAARLGGGHIYETLAHSIGADPVELWFRDQAGLSHNGPVASRTPGSYGFLLVPPRQGTLVEIGDLPLPDGVLQHSLPTTLPKAFDAATASTDTVASFLVHGADAGSVESALRRCALWSAAALRWSS